MDLTSFTHDDQTLEKCKLTHRAYTLKCTNEKLDAVANETAVEGKPFYLFWNPSARPSTLKGSKITVVFLDG